MTRSFFATSASRAASSVTSREMGWAFFTPSESFLALSMVLQAGVFVSSGIGEEGIEGIYQRKLGFLLH